MSIRTILAPGVQVNEIDRSQYSPSMTGSNCYVMGFTDKGEPYQPMEFTSRTAWTSYYGTPDNEAERYAYAAACEVLNQNGRLRFARLPYDNAALDKVVAFKYNVSVGKQISCKSVDGADSPFFEVKEADKTICEVAAVEPGKGVALYDLSAIDEYRTGETAVPNNSFIIADMTFGTYGRIPEDERKNEKREIIGIMPVITTAANALYQQKLIDVARENVIGFETIGSVQSLDATPLSASFPKLSACAPNVLRASDSARLLNTSEYYRYTSMVFGRVPGSVEINAGDAEDDIVANIKSYLASEEVTLYKPGSWDGSYQISAWYDDSISAEVSAALFTYIRGYTEAQVSADPELDALYGDKFGWHNPEGDEAVPDTVSQEANSYFPTIEFDGDRFDRTHMKKIGIVVYRMYMDPSEGNKVNFEPVEAYAGSLCKTDKDPNTGATTFIDDIVNSQSRYINVFSNCFNTPADKKYYASTLDMLVVQPGSQSTPAASVDDVKISLVGDFGKAIDYIADLYGVDFMKELEKIGDIKVSVLDIYEKISKLEAAARLLEEDETTLETLGQIRNLIQLLVALVDKYAIKHTVCPSLGFYSEMTRETISISKSIYDGMNKCFDKAEDLNKFDIDVVPDAGIANIASYLKALYGDRGEYDLTVVDDMGNSLLGMWRCDSNNAAVKTWKTVEQKLDNFCKNVRKDCMFIADGPRPLVLAGQKKIVRPSKPSNTIDANIIPNIKWVTGLNTSYGALYVDWFEQADDYTGDLFWCPPSIKAMGVYVNTDVNFNYWDAPAGLNRGVIAATDVAFSPTIKQAGAFYEKNLNYAINYPNDGIVLEGQKTLQTKPTALDRVNVRRLMLRLERATAKCVRWFLYEGNTAYTRQRIVDAIDPYFKNAKNCGGIYDYKIVCDESNNTPQIIDNNELYIAIGVKPVKAIEFIMCNFIIAATGMSWEEAGL